MTGLSRRQKQTYDFIVAHIHDHDYAPTYRRIATALGVNPSVARKYVARLGVKGYVTTKERIGIQGVRQTT